MYSKGCRCEPCRVAHRLYERQKNRERSREKMGLELRPVRFVDPAEARDHLLFLRSKGVGSRAVAEKTGFSHHFIQSVANGRAKRIGKKYADSILAVSINDILKGQYVPVGNANELIDDLLARGFSRRQIAKGIGTPKSADLRLKKFIRHERMEKLKVLHSQVMRSAR
jgi:hypothetical protein